MNRPLTELTNEEPWRTCYAQLGPKLLLFARQWVGSVADAEDVVQTAFVKFWRHQPEAGFEHYPLLYSAVRTSALDLIRADSRRGRREQVVATDPDEPFFDATIERNESACLINSALQLLPESQREVLVLRIWGELSFAEIATTLGDSINTVASRYRYALDGLRRILKPHEYQRA
ncbi:MAG: sigma-70 family RNA polymerase sigma factor [Chthoniobacteraceae bacterium]